MTDLEDRVRDALLARAGEFTASPDAWERTRARAGDRAIRRHTLNVVLCRLRYRLEQFEHRPSAPTAPAVPAASPPTE